MNTDAPSDTVDPDTRTRTYTWPEPPADGGHNTASAGLPALQAMIAGERPLSPAAYTLGLRATSAEEGLIVMTATPAEWALNNGGTVHGGIVSGWVDSALGYATASVVEEGVGFNTLDLTVRYIRALRPDRTPATIRAEVEHAGRTTSVVQVKVIDSEGRTCASASGVMVLFRP